MGDALQEAIDLACDDDDELGHSVKALVPKIASRASMDTYCLPLDTVANSIQRRQFKQIYKEEPESVISIHVYSDGSPVTGSKVQGMVIDIAFITGLIQTIVMPGCVMLHGRSRAVDKAIVFLHALTLLYGFDVGLLEWVSEKSQALPPIRGSS